MTQDHTGSGWGPSPNNSDPVAVQMREAMARGKGCGCGGSSYIGDTALTSYVEAEAERIRSMGLGCNRMFLSDYLGCTPIDRQKLCTRRGFAYTNDAGARSRGARIVSGESNVSSATLNPGSAFEVLRSLELLDTIERRRPVLDAQVESMAYTSSPPTGYYGGFFTEPVDVDTTSEIASGVGVLLTMTPKSGFSGPATANINIRLSNFAFGANPTALPFILLETPGQVDASVLLPTVEYSMKITFEKEIMIFVPFWELIAARGRSTIASCGYIPGLELTDDDALDLYYRLFDGNVAVLSSDVLTNVDSRIIGSGSQMLPEALALLTVGKPIVDGGVLWPAVAKTGTALAPAPLRAMTSVTMRVTAPLSTFRTTTRTRFSRSCAAGLTFAPARLSCCWRRARRGSPTQTSRGC